jgi:uncharacterized lipoprotein YajG
VKTIFKFLFILGAVCLLPACAFIPEQIHLNPEITPIQSKNIGNREKIAIQVIDVRSNSSLGGRPSGYGPAANISLADDIQAVIKNTISQGLSNYNFIPVSSNSPARKKLTLRITALNYNQRTGFFTGSSVVDSAIEVTALNNQRSFDNVYRYQKNRDVMFTPTTMADSKEINSVLSNILNQILHDPALLDFLAHS